MTYLGRDYKVEDITYTDPETVAVQRVQRRLTLLWTILGTLGAVLICGGFAWWLHPGAGIAFLGVAMTVWGLVVANAEV